MVGWVKKNKDWVVPLVGVVVFILLAAGLGKYFQGSSNQIKKHEELRVFEKVDIKPQESEKGKSEDQAEAPSANESKAFFLRPSASEIIEAIDGLPPVELDEKTKEFPGLRVMWPLYFFKLDTEEGDASIQLDVSEDGFGVSILCDVDVEKYPEIYDIEPGELLWVAGEIIGVDPEGTGQILIKTEQIRFGGAIDQPPTAPVYEKSTVQVGDQAEEKSVEADSNEGKMVKETSIQ